MEVENKDYTKLKLATCLRQIMKAKKTARLKNKEDDIEDLVLVDSLRQLEAASGLSFTILQGVSVGKRDLKFTTLQIMLESLGITFSEFASLYDKITDKQIREAEAEIEINRKKKPSKEVKRKLFKKN